MRAVELALYVSYPNETDIIPALLTWLDAPPPVFFPTRLS